MHAFSYDTRDVDTAAYTEWAERDVTYALKRVTEARAQVANLIELGARVCLAMDFEAMP